MDEKTQIFLKSFDILFLNETHFNERIKCPDGFIFEGRSEKVESKFPRGGVAVYRNERCPLRIEILCSTMRDCIIIEVKNTGIVIAGQYIPPSNSVYYSNIYMDNLELMHAKFNKKRFLLLGDMNARVGDVQYENPTITHSKNPDNTVNNSGRKLLKWINQRQDMVMLNGLWNFDSNYTFYREKKQCHKMI